MSALIQQTPEWHAIRKTHVGASDAPIIMGISPWKTPYQLWEEKLGIRKNEVNSAMRRGLELEDKARSEFERQTGLIVFPEVLFHQEYNWMMASLDGIDIEHQNLVEIKCPGIEDHTCAMDGVIPSKYYPQLQHQMIVANVDSAFYFSYTSRSSKILEVERDKKYEAMLIEREQDFMRCLNELEAPALTEKDYIIRCDDIWDQTAKEWLQVHSQIEELRPYEERLRRNLARMSGSSNTRGAGIKMSRIVRKGSIDYKAIPEIQGIDLEIYRKQPIEMWRIGVE